MGRTFIAAALVVLAQPRELSAAPAEDCAGVFLFRPNGRLSIQELSSLAAEPQHADGPNAWSLLAHTTDWESTARRGRWDLLAVVYAGHPDLGGTVVGGTLWVRRREAFGTAAGATFATGEDGLSLTFAPVDPIAGCRKGFRFRLDPVGVLFANGARVGQAKPL